MYSTLTMLWRALGDPAAGKVPPRRRPAFRRPLLEVLEDRSVPPNLTAANISDLTADINYANAHPGASAANLPGSGRCGRPGRRRLTGPASP